MRSTIRAVVLVALVTAAGCSASRPEALASAHPEPSSTLSATPSSRPTPSPAPSSLASAAPAPDRIVQDAAAAVVAAETFRFHMRLAMTASSTDPITQIADGQTATVDPRRSTIRVSTEDGAGGADMIHDADAIYLRGPGFENQTGPGKWLKIALDSDDPRMAEPVEVFAHSLDPRMWVYLLFGSTDVAASGAAVIGGLETTSFTMAVDLQRTLAQAPDDVASPLEAGVRALEAATSDGEALTVDGEAWIDAQGTLRRMTCRATWGDAPGGRRSDVSIDLSAFGEPMQLDVPETADTVLYGTPLQ